jgi:hypothetical protein
MSKRCFGRLIYFSVSRVAIASLVAGELFFACARAEGGRDFTGSYRVVGPPVAGTLLSVVSLELHLQNVSGAGIDNAVIELDSHAPAPAAQNFPQSIAIPNHGFVTLTGTFRVPTHDAQRWAQGGLPGPEFAVIAPNQKGLVVRRKVEMTKRSEVTK